MPTRIQRIGLVLILLAPMTVWSCEPILPLAQLLGGSTALGPLMWEQSVAWLSAAIAVKSISFACFEKRIPWQRALFFMLLANLLSTIPGMLVAMFTAASGSVILALPVI